MKLIFLLLIMILFMGFVNAEDTIILKSGRKIEGIVVIKENDIHLICKYGTIIFKASEVTIEPPKEGSKFITDVSVKNGLTINPTPVMLPVACQLTTRSGRKLIGNVYQKGEEIFLVDLGGIVRIDPFVLTKKEEIGESGIEGEIISGERCNIVLKSGRSFSGIVDEMEGSYFVSSALGMVKIEKKDVENIEQTGYVLNLKEEESKYADISEMPAVVITKSAAQIARDVNQNKISDIKDMKIEEMVKINKKAEEALEAAKKEADQRNKLKAKIIIKIIHAFIKAAAHH